jgi:exopolysaccharide biosynthesis polyprenyl glycosylphosphotransferase
MTERHVGTRRSSAWLYLKPMVDACLFVVAFLLAYLWRYQLQWLRTVEPSFLVPIRVYIPSIIALTLVLLVVYWVEGAYRTARGRTLLDELFVALRSTVVGIAAIIVMVFLATPSYYSRLIFGYTGIAALLLVSISRTIERVVQTRRLGQGIGVDRTLIVGVGESGRSVIRAIMARPELGYRIVGFLDDDPDKAHANIGPFPGLGSTEALVDVIGSATVDVVIIALPSMYHRKTLQMARVAENAGARVRIVPDLFQIAVSSVVIENLDGLPLLAVREPSLFDIVISLVTLVVTSPVLAILAIAIKLDSPGPVIFRQTRVGRDQRLFTCLKFRTMSADAEARLEELKDRNEADGPLFKMRDDPRRTRVGRFLRRVSLDEVPQFWNVLRGEMSVIGPRPPIPAEVVKYEPWHLRRLDTAPGITGLWQVSGRSDLTFDEMVLLDIYYIENWSPLLDVRILLKTIPTMLFGSGAY